MQKIFATTENYMKPISKTAFYTCGVRMQDAERSDSLCGDIYAKSFMNEEGLRINQDFKEETRANDAILARHRIIDDFLRQELAANPRLRVVLIGAGFDSRPFRLKGGDWIELDEPQVIEYKNERLPVGNCENALERIAIDFSNDSLAEKLSAFSTDDPVVIIIEGVFIYLEEDAIKPMLLTLRRLFPRHKLIGDLINRQFFEEYAKTMHEKLNGLGASFKFTNDDPEKTFLENGYCRLDKISIVEKTVDYGLLDIPKVVLDTKLTTLKNGNAVYVFEVC